MPATYSFLRCATTAWSTTTFDVLLSQAFLSQVKLPRKVYGGHVVQGVPARLGKVVRIKIQYVCARAKRTVAEAENNLKVTFEYSYN